MQEEAAFSEKTANMTDKEVEKTKGPKDTEACTP